MDLPGVTEIRLRDGCVAKIDLVDLPLVVGYRWHCLHTVTGRQYATTWSGGRMHYMHRLIAQTPPGLTTDHINNDGLDNRRANLRVATWTQNVANVAKVPTRRGRPTTSKYKGVSWDKARSKWAAKAKIDGKVRHLGRYDSEIEAARAYDEAAYAAWGEFAVLNLPERLGQANPYEPGRKKPPPRTHCPQKHPFTPENTYVTRKGWRHCRTCKRLSDQRRRAAARAAA